ncbi:plasmid stabilization protein [Grimontia hollisae]|uniref:Plasmid maintenance system killer protein n=1 Tax=Grimontia hollisae TaxID=673 RepID=A0A377J7F2_GRIHO|nr:plasmid stabilization protein [Grimontia hollisae]STO77343.1 Uncharacterised protein [Grimontia hollisae]STO98422.1 Uncharacterised protein [Grimontia hollisae]STQ75752.1 Uncharacterised protein [Grimontia hollisae]
MNQIVTTPAFERRLKKFLKKHPDMQAPLKKVLKMIQLNQLGHPSLRLHKIEGKNCHSVSLNMSYRLMVEIRIKQDGTVLLIDIGNHDDVY